jgi:NTE family protein
MTARSNRKIFAEARVIPFERVALVLQGGGALGAYQAGVYEALAEGGISPNWIK